MAFPKFDANCSRYDPHGGNFTNQNRLWCDWPDVLFNHRLQKRERDADHGGQANLFRCQLHQPGPHLRSPLLPHQRTPYDGTSDVEVRTLFNYGVFHSPYLSMPIILGYLFISDSRTVTSLNLQMCT